MFLTCNMPLTERKRREYIHQGNLIFFLEEAVPPVLQTQIFAGVLSLAIYHALVFKRS